MARELWRFFLGKRSTDRQSASGSGDTQVLRNVQTEGHLCPLISGSDLGVGH